MKIEFNEFNVKKHTTEHGIFRIHGVYEKHKEIMDDTSGKADSIRLLACRQVDESNAEIESLLTAAPDLLEACEAVLENVDPRIYALEEILLKCRQAIEKAGGGE